MYVSVHIDESATIEVQELQREGGGTFWILKAGNLNVFLEASQLSAVGMATSPYIQPPPVPVAPEEM